MIDTRKTKFSIHSLNLEEIDNSSHMVKKGVVRQFRSTIKRPISNVQSAQQQIQNKSNLLNKEVSLSSMKNNLNGRGKTLQIRNVSLNLPQIRYSPISAEIEDCEEKGGDIVSYSSGKLNNYRDRFVHNVKERYYKKIEVMKEIKVPMITHQLLSIDQSSNISGTSFVKDLNYASQIHRASLMNKKSLPNVTLQKYQILREKQDIEIPKQLQAKKFHTLHGFSTISTESKNAIRFKFDQMLSKQKKSMKKAQEKSDRRQIQGWQSDNHIGFQHQLMFD